MRIGSAEGFARPSPSSLRRRPEARVLKIEDLLREVVVGRVRVPPFQRPLRWRARNVVELFDSAYRGYPIGDLLFTQQPGPDEVLSFGARLIRAGARPDAWYIVDGQQRVTAFVGALLHPDSRPAGDVHAIWFDLIEERFHWVAAGLDVSDFWVPVRALADARELHRWWNNWPRRTENEDLVERLYEVSKAIREYEIPVYVLHEAPEDAVREVFQRVNTRGTQMGEAEVFDALHAIGGEKKPLDRVADQIAMIGFGRLDSKLLMRCVKAAIGADPGADLSAADVDMERVSTSLRRAVLFLKEDAGVPHFRLMPYFVPLVILAKVFAVHADLETRDRTLLSRWVWRGWLNGRHTRSAHAEVRRLQALVRGVEPSDDVAALLREVSDEEEREALSSMEMHWVDPWESWVGTSARVKLAELALIHMGPRGPNGEALDLLRLCERMNTEGPGRDFLRVREDSKDTIVGRFLLFGGRPALKRLMQCQDEDILRSHGLTEEAGAHWRRGDVVAMLNLRAHALSEEFRVFFDARAEWGASDRPSIRNLVRRAQEVLDAGP